MSEPRHCAIFDLDGTLADTARDIARSVNLTRGDYRLDPLPLDQVVACLGDGSRSLLIRSFAGHAIDWDEGLERMEQHYFASPVVDTTVYPGVIDGLAVLKQAGWKLAVVTNKTGFVAREILKILKITPFMDDIIGGREGFRLKPDPGAMLHLLAKYGADPKKSWVLGDNHTDLNSGANAGMNGAFAAWGFGFPGDAVCTAVVDSFPKFVRLVTGRRR